MYRDLVRYRNKLHGTVICDDTVRQDVSSDENMKSLREK